MTIGATIVNRLPELFLAPVEHLAPFIPMPAVDQVAANTVPLNSQPEVTYPFNFPDAATTSYDFTVQEAFELLDVVCQKRGAAGAGNTVQVKKGATAVSDAIACATDTNVTRASTIDDAQSSFAVGDTLRITVTRAAGNAACQVWLKGLRR